MADNLTTKAAIAAHEKLVMTVPQAGALLGLSRDASYAAAARGDIPTIRIGHLLKVPVVQFNRLLNDAKYTVTPRSHAQTSQPQRRGAVDDTTDLA